jgi:hypothetical protein
MMLIRGADLGSRPGRVVRGSIESVNPQQGIAYVRLAFTQSPTLQPVKIPAGWIGPRGQFSGGYPQRGTPIFVVQSQGNEWVFVAYDQPDGRGAYDQDGLRRADATSKFRPGRWLTVVENDVSAIVDPKVGVITGSSEYFTQSDPIKGIYSSRFLQELHFSDAHRSITGPIRRDIRSNRTRGSAYSTLTSHDYDVALDTIGLDPKTRSSISTAGTRNPALTESRSMYYEFASSYGYTSDEEENRLYAGEDLATTKPYQRKRSRTDTMSLSLDQPNFLAEIIIGTVVDIYGNILDINRNVLPNGIIDSLSFRNSEDDKDFVFRKLREQLRKSIAYHFEINARKENVQEITGRSDPGVFTPEYDDTSDYARSRSQFSIDIDKEGQFKINVPASSEVGNIGLLVRHENFSNLKGAEEDKDRGQFLRNATNNTDVKLEPFGQGVIELKSNEETLKSFAAPTNRINGEVIKLGTAFHEISEVAFPHKINRIYDSGGGTGGYPASVLNEVDPVEDVVSPEIIVAGSGANAGGRSGTISLDGMLSLSIGANTADRQSLWLDTAGGIVTAIGRDRWQRSIVGKLDGDVLLEVGGATVNDDSRFPSATFRNEVRDGTIDIRVYSSGSFHTFRIDSQGINIHTPQRIVIVSEGDMRFKSVNSNIFFDAEGIYMYGGSVETATRLVARTTEGAAGRTIR